jgi:stearoyl-CoA desaturase (delta-9 desaturase)
MFRHELTNPNVFARDLLRDALLVRLNRLYGVFVLLGLLLPSLAGWLLIGGAEGALRGLVWGGLVRLASVYNSTFAVNALCHLFGSRRFDTPDNSRNLAWLSVLTAGDGWHNNHHGRPNAACFSTVWWEIDPGYLVIVGLKRLGLARNLNR